MKFVCHAKSLTDLSDLNEGTEVIVSPSKLSRLGELSLEETLSIYKEAERLNLVPIIEWDLLETENLLSDSIKFFRENLKDWVQRVRVFDLGVFQYLLEETEVLIDLVTEMGNHNLIGHKQFEKIGKQRLRRLVLSHELPFEKIEEISKAINCPTEILVHGPLLLFYSPRKLLSPLVSRPNERLALELNSEESPHRGFRTYENQHGTLMYHPRDFSLLDFRDQLMESQVGAVRFDTRFNPEVFTLMKDFQEGKELKGELLNRPTIRGYFGGNKSDVLFKMLKNSATIRNDELFVGRVVDVEKGNYISIQIEEGKNLERQQQIRIETPDGKKKSVRIPALFDLNLLEKDKMTGPCIALISHIGGTSVKSMIFTE